MLRITRKEAYTRKNPEDFLYISIFISFLMESVFMLFQEWFLKSVPFIIILWIVVPYSIIIPCSSILYFIFIKNLKPPTLRLRRGRYMRAGVIIMVAFLGLFYPYFYVFWGTVSYLLFILLMSGISLINLIPWVLFGAKRDILIAFPVSFINTIVSTIYISLEDYPFAHHPNTMLGMIYLLSGIMEIVLLLMARRLLNKRSGNDSYTT